MGADSIKEVLPKASDTHLSSLLNQYYIKHLSVCDITSKELESLETAEENPGILSKVAAKASTESKLFLNHSPHEIADIMIDGCVMGIKSLSKTINHTPSASLKALGIADNLVKMEQSFMDDLRDYL